MTIVPYTKADLDEIMKIENVSFSAPWSRQSYEELAPLETISFWVAKEGDKVAGYMLFQYVAGEMELHTLAVLPVLQRKGVAIALLKHMLEEAKRLGIVRIFLQVRPSNNAARRLYEKFGFKIVGVRPRYYRDDNEDAFVMKMDIW